MKFDPTALGTALASATLAALVALPVQNAGGTKPQNPPKPKPPAAKPQDPAPAPAPKAGDETKPAQHTDANGNTVTFDPDAAITARYLKAAEIGDEHKWLGGLVGKWKTLTHVLIKPNATAMESTGTSELKLFMDGRFLIENNTSGGAQGNSSGMGIIGFNNMTKKYERVWFDTHSTAMIKSEGDYNKERDEIRWTDQWCDPTSGKITTTQSSLHRLDDKNFIFMQVATLPNKQEYIMLRVEYKKAE